VAVWASAGAGASNVVSRSAAVAARNGRDVM
jgi:hypothetical protein